MRAAAVFALGILAGADLVWWLTHENCKWSPVDCIHFWHHALFLALYITAAALVARQPST